MKQNRKAFEGRAVSGPQNIKRRVDMAEIMEEKNVQTPAETAAPAEAAAQR